MVGPGTSADPEATSDHETFKEPDALSSCIAVSEGMPFSVSSSSYWEKVTTPDATFLGEALVAGAAHAGVAVPGGMYSGLGSSTDPIISRPHGATNFEHPRA